MDDGGEGRYGRNGMKFDAEKLHQDNTKAEIYRLLRNAGIGCCLEYRHKIKGQRSCIFDLIVVRNRRILLIVEAKNTPNWGWGNKKQHGRYSRFGVPVWLVTSFCQAKSVAEEIIDHIESSKPFPKFRSFRK